MSDHRTTCSYCKREGVKLVEGLSLCAGCAGWLDHKHGPGFAKMIYPSWKEVLRRLSSA